jgi:ribosomal protein L20A (L18A)
MKVFKVTGQICKPNLNTAFVKEVIADKEEHASKNLRRNRQQAPRETLSPENQFG